MDAASLQAVGHRNQRNQRNHRMDKVRRTTLEHLVQPPCLTRAIPEHTVQDCILVVLEYLQ